MVVAHQPVVVRLTVEQALRCEKLGSYLWPQEKLSVEEISRRLLLEHLLWAESEHNLVEQVKLFVQGTNQSRRSRLRSRP
jgi:hypothetical protein